MIEYTKKRRVRAVILAMLIVPLIYLSALARNKTEFPHSDHLEEASCAECHLSGKGKEPEIPDQKSCTECHDDGKEESVTGNAPFQESYPFTFSHTAHTIQECQTCHIISETGLPATPSYTECSMCHKAINKKMTCSQCHTSVVTIPLNHNGPWNRTHGKRTDFGNDVQGHGKDCRICHGSSACQSCHRDNKPSSHTGFFRVRGHGLKADIEKESCSVCHQEASCVRCHRETRPLNHKGTWRTTHGLAIPGGVSGASGKCSLCHSTASCTECHTH